MKNLSKVTLGALGLGLCLTMSGCGGLGGALGLPYAVTYSVEVGAPATVTLIQYTDAGGITRTVNDPVLPWGIGTTASSGDVIRIRVRGRMSTGALTEFVKVKANASTVGVNKNIDKTYRSNSSYDESASVTLD